MASRPKLRNILREKQGGRCCYCRGPMTPPAKYKPGGPPPTSETLEHLKRVQDGGTNHWDNMALSCYACNTGRGATDWLTYASYRAGELSA